MEKLKDIHSSRKGFLMATLGAFAVVLSGGRGKALGKGPGSEKTGHSKPEGHLWGMVIDLDKCTGCGACVVACSAENNQVLGSPAEAAMGRVIRWLKILPSRKGEYPLVEARLLPITCLQCEHPPCTKVCPVNATYRNEEGIVGQVYARCIGCRYCLNACPYTVKFFNWKQPVWPVEMEDSFNPDVSVRPIGVTEKCLFCHHRLQRAKEEAAAQGRALLESDYQPACAEVCPANAITFGDLNNRDSAVAVLTRDARAFHLLEELGTEPKVTYLKEKS